MAVKDSNGRWKNTAGNYVAARHIPAIEKMRDRMVERHVKKARRIKAMIEEFKKEIYEDIEDYFEAERKIYGQDSSNSGGNKWFADYAGEARIEMSSSKSIDFDDRIWIVQDKLMAYLDDAMSGGRDVEGVRAIVQIAFKTSQYGKLDKARLLTLRGLKGKIRHPLVDEALTILGECMLEMGRRVNIRIQVKDSRQDSWEALNMDFSRI